MACGKQVLISDQVNIWREIIEDGAGLVEEDTEEGVEKLLRRFVAKGRRHEAGSMRHEAKSMKHEAKGRRHEAKSRRHEAGGGPDGVACGIVSLPHAKASPPQAEPSEVVSPSRAKDGPRECYLKRFAIGPAAARLNNILKGD